MNSKLTRLLVVSEPGKDGVFDFVRGLVAYLHQTHPEITVDLAYSSRRSSAALPNLVKAVQSQGGEAIDLKVGNAPVREDLSATKLIADLVQRRKPQLVHAHSSKAGGLVRLLRLTRPGFPPVIYTPHAYYGLGAKRSLAALVFNTVEALLGRVGQTVCCSLDERKFGVKALGLPRRRLVVINNGIDVERFRPPTPKEKLLCRAEFGFPETGNVLVSVGRDTPQKNYGPLYTALNRLLSEPQTPFFFAHAGSGSQELGAKLSPVARSRFLGFEQITAVERFLRAADGFILTSRYEGLSLAMLQALNTGLKLFLTRVPGNQCLIAAGFSQVDWIEPSDDQTEQSFLIENALRPRLSQPLQLEENQVEMARQAYDSRIQLSKLYRLYTSQRPN